MNELVSSFRALQDQLIAEGKLVKNSPESRVMIRVANRLAELEADFRTAYNALKFYANAENYEPVPQPTFVSEDAGAKARFALVVIDNV